MALCSPPWGWVVRGHDEVAFRVGQCRRDRVDEAMLA